MTESTTIDHPLKWLLAQLPDYLTPEQHARLTQAFEAHKRRYVHARRAADELVSQDGYTLLDCSDGDLTPLNLALSAPESNAEYAPESENPF